MNTLIKFLLIINIITLNQNTAFAAAAEADSIRPRRPNPMMASLGAALMEAREKRQKRMGAGSDKICDGVGTGTANAERPKKPERVNPFMDALSGNKMFGATRKEEYVVEGVGSARTEPVASATGHSYKGAADPKLLVPTGLMAELLENLARRAKAGSDEDKPAAAAFATASPASASATPEGEGLMVAEKAEEAPAAATVSSGWTEGWVPDLSNWGVSIPTVGLPDLSGWMPSASAAKGKIPDLLMEFVDLKKLADSLPDWMPSASAAKVKILYFLKYLPSGKFVDLRKLADSLPDDVLDAFLANLGYDEEGYTTANE